MLMVVFMEVIMAMRFLRLTKPYSIPNHLDFPGDKMKILSIFWGTLCSGAGLMVDGKVVAAVSEERFTGKMMWHSH